MSILNKKLQWEDDLILLQEFEEDGQCTRECPICHAECEPNEIDNGHAFCPNCDQVVDVVPVI
jgi:hypothetical protein